MTDSYTFEELPVFNELSDKVVSKLQERSWEVTGKPGSPIYFSNDSANLVYFVLSGKVRLYYPSSRDREITLEFVEPGEMFGEFSLVGFESRGESAEAVTDCQLVVIPGEFFYEVMEDNLELYRRIFKEISRRRWRVQNRLKTLALEDAEKRVIYVLLDLSGKLSGSFSDGEEKPKITLTHEALSEMANLARPTTTKILNQLSEDQLITLEQGTITLDSPKSLFEKLDLPQIAESP